MTRLATFAAIATPGVAAAHGGHPPATGFVHDLAHLALGLGGGAAVLVIIGVALWAIRVRS